MKGLVFILKVIPPVLIFIVGLQALAWGTQNWTVWTEETARRQRLIQSNYQIDHLSLINQDNEALSFKDLFHNDNSIVLMNFIFTRCPTVCVSLGYEFQQIQHHIRNTSYYKDVYFLSVSFDHEHDQPLELNQYLQRFSADTQQWSAVKVNEPNRLKHLLQELGVIVIPDDTFGYIHNAALYAFEGQKITHIFDVDQTVEILDFLQQAKIP